MVTIGVDPHKQTHTAAAVNDLGVELSHRTAAARPVGNGQLLEWARALGGERVWAIEDVRNVSGSLERFLIDRGETVVRLAPQLMAGARRGAWTRGKSDPIDARRSLVPRCVEGAENLPTARFAGPEREIRQLALYRERLLDMRTRLINELRWQLHDLWPDWEIPAKALTHLGWQTKVASRLARAEQTIQVQIARDTVRRARELSRATKDLYEKIGALVKQVAPQLLAEPGIGVAAGGKVHRRDRRDRPLRHRCAARPHSRLRPDPCLIRPVRPLPPGSRRQPAPQQRLLHARCHPHQPRPPHRRLPREAAG